MFIKKITYFEPVYCALRPYVSVFWCNTVIIITTVVAVAVGDSNERQTLPIEERHRRALGMSDSGLPCVALSQLGSAAAAEVGLTESARSCSSLGGSPLPAGSLNGCIRARTECRARSWRRSSSVIVGEQQQHRRGRKRRKVRGKLRFR